MTRAVIEYFVKRLSEAGTSPTRTRVMKLVYLADVASYRARGSQLTDLQWRFLHYGPYAAAVTDTLEQLASEGLTSRTTDQEEHGEETFVSYWRRSPELGSGVRDTLGLSPVLLLQDVFREWGDAALNRLLDHVYFETEPMKNAQRFAALDFSTITLREEEEAEEDRGEALLTERLARGLRSLDRPGDEAPSIAVPHDLGDFDFAPEGDAPLSLHRLRGKRMELPEGTIGRIARSFGTSEPE